MKRTTYHKPPKILKAKNGIVIKVERHYDKAILFVGQETQSGGKILSLNCDTDFAGDMSAEIGEKGKYTSLSAIVLK